MTERLVPISDAAGQAYVEWRVTADHKHPAWQDERPYEFIWSPLRNPQHGDAEDAARRFVEHFAKSGHMANIKLTRRTVTIEAWEDVWPRGDTPGMGSVT